MLNNYMLDIKGEVNSNSDFDLEYFTFKETDIFWTDIIQYYIQFSAYKYIP